MGFPAWGQCSGTELHTEESKEEVEGLPAGQKGCRGAKGQFQIKPIFNETLMNTGKISVNGGRHETAGMCRARL